MNRKKNKRTDDMKKVLISIKGLPGYAENDDEAFELLTDGEYIQEGGISTFRYLERSLTGQIDGGLLTTFDVEPERIILHRDDDIGGEMIFSESQKHHFLQDTPFGVVMMGIDTQSIRKDMNDDGGSIEIRYNIEIDNVAVSRNMFQINITSLPQ